jgi:hypothetical protein
MLLDLRQCFGSGFTDSRIRIQHFWLNADPYRIHGFFDQKWEKFYSWKEFDIFLHLKLQFTYPLASMKDVNATGEAFCPQNMKFL